MFPEWLLPDFIEFGELNLYQLTWLRSKLRFPYWCRKATLQSKSVQMTKIIDSISETKVRGLRIQAPLEQQRKGAEHQGVRAVPLTRLLVVPPWSAPERAGGT